MCVRTHAGSFYLGKYLHTAQLDRSNHFTVARSSSTCTMKAVISPLYFSQSLFDVVYLAEAPWLVGLPLHVPLTSSLSGFFCFNIYATGISLLSGPTPPSSLSQRSIRPLGEPWTSAKVVSFYEGHLSLFRPPPQRSPPLGHSRLPG